MLPSPYTPGRPAQVLAGRARERAWTSQQLDRVAALGDYGGPLQVVHAPRGIGKTSLLRSAEREARSKGFVTVWVSAVNGGSVAAELVYALRSALEAVDAITDKQRKVWHASLSKLELHLGVAGAGVRATIDTARTAAKTAAKSKLPAAPPAADAPVSALEQFLRDASTLVRSTGGSGVVLFIDEVHAADKLGLGIILNALQNLDGSSASAALTAMFAGLPNAPDVVTSAATFGERSRWVPLGRLDDTDSAVALAKPAQDSGVVWDRDARDRVVRDAGGYPYFLQLLGSTTWEAAGPGPGSTLTLDHVRTGYTDALRQLLTLFQTRWSKASNGHKRFIVAMVELMLETGSEDVDRGRIAEKLGRTTREISVPRNRLIGQDIIEPSGYGRVRFTIPGFAAYVAAEAGLPGAERLRELTRFPELGAAADS
ncbi:MAG TPA: ATP-binding protein [Nocardioides sp.]|uniref:ATP-binding protein n=1 Tax=Nocardioides sp. TaxID=35761 RepID=UPI002E322791|nr:ATP-binding protein [Nocardioides sp.]HEX5087457.1 ATP-binding protein [Nocardioides sp.]